MIAAFRFRHRNTVCFVGIDLVLYTKTHSSSYINQSSVVCIIYRAPNIGAITGSADRSEKDLNTVLNRPE